MRKSPAAKGQIESDVVLLVRVEMMGETKNKLIVMRRVAVTILSPA